MAISGYNTTAASNTLPSPNGAPEGMPPSDVNNIQRQQMANDRAQWNDAQWFEYLDGTPDGVVAYVATNQFKITGADATAYWAVGRKVKLVDVSPLTTYATITATVYGSGATTVTCDTTALTAVAITAYASIISSTNSSLGDITATTITADGDTSAGDLATMGYTATEGLVLTGQGSTNDITIKNDADADVMTVPTGGVLVDFAGTVNVAGAVTVAGTAAAVYSGTGSPEGVHAYAKGSIYLRTDGSTGTAFYVKETGLATSTGWVAK